MNQNRQEFNSAPSEWERTYFDETTGGFLLIHQRHNRGESFDSELFIAIAFAKMGKQVILLDESETVDGKRPDAEIDGEIWDFKRLTEKTVSIDNRLQAGIREARKQGAARVAFHIDRQEFNLESALRGIRRALFLDQQGKIKSVSLVYCDGKIEEYTLKVLGI